MSLGTLLIIVLVLVLVFGALPGPWAGPSGAAPYWGTGYYGGGGIGLVIIILLVLVLLGRL